jgi:hypothetical protein
MLPNFKKIPLRLSIGGAVGDTLATPFNKMFLALYREGITPASCPDIIMTIKPRRFGHLTGYLYVP